MEQRTGVASGFWGRLRLYLFGIAIGLMLLGFFHMAKRNEAAAKQAAAERARNQPAGPDPLFPPLPAAEARKP